MRRNLHLAAAATLGVLAASSGGLAPAHATTGRRADYALDLSARDPGAPTAATFHIVYKDPANPQGKPPPIRKVVLELPRGLRIDTGAAAVCGAGDAELRTLGRDACPASSRIGQGTLLAMTGVAPVDPVRGDVTVFNGGDALIELVSFAGTNVTAGIDRLSIHGDTLVGAPPTTPGGPPDGETAVRQIDLVLPSRAGSRSFMTAPADCPADGRWASTGSFGFADGGTDVVTSTTPCVAPVRPRSARRPSRACRRARSGRTHSRHRRASRCRRRAR